MIDFIITLLGCVTIASAVYVVTSKNLVRSAVALFFTLFGIISHYVALYDSMVPWHEISEVLLKPFRPQHKHHMN